MLAVTRDGNVTESVLDEHERVWGQKHTNQIR